MSFNTPRQRSELAVWMATFLDDLMKAGFTREEAMQIIVAFVRAHCSVPSF